MKKISLLNDWRLLERPLSLGKDGIESVIDTVSGWIDIKSLPCDVHTALKNDGIIKDPLVGNGSFECEWIEDRSWWFAKSFDLNEEELFNFGAELFIETLDIHADIFLNGRFVSHHASAMYPFRKDVSPWLKSGENTLVIRLTTGLERANDEDIAEVRDFVSCEYRRRREGRGDDRRTMLRKPQYVFGWDQSPRLATCAIAGDVRLELLDEVVVRDIRFETLKTDGNTAELLVEAEIESRALTTARECLAEFTLEINGKNVYSAKKDYLSQCGVNYIDFSFILDSPELWWPNGYGKQPIYTASVKVFNNNGAYDEKSIRTGIRTVKLDTSRLNEKERRYTFFVNGKPIYCRGADFIMSNHIYAEITDSLQDKILSAARDAHFCMVRFWDGNIYQTDSVYELCDKYGIMVIQNFCFACGAYPDHIKSFCDEVEKEAEYQLKRLRNHPSLSLWYGNGENSSILMNYLGMNFFEKHSAAQYYGGTYLYNQLLPKLHRAYSASVGYQCTTPFGGFESSECEERGDRHYYPFLNISPENQQYRISKESIDPLKCKFITEGGIMGPPSAKALIAYCGGKENTDYDSPVFLHHRNTFEKDAVRDAIYKHYTGERELSLEEYCLYGGLFQGTLLGYEAEHIRIQPDCSGSVLWCMNDGFGEVGFSIMDHFGDPKPVYYYLKRAYAPQRLILRKDGDRVNVYLTNSSPECFNTKLTYGYVSLDGNVKKNYTADVKLEAFSSACVVAEIPVENADFEKGLFFASGEGLDSATLYYNDFYRLELPRRAKLTLNEVEAEEGGLVFSITSDVYAHGVHFDLPDGVMPSDCYFDLLPGESKTVTIKKAEKLVLSDITAQCVFVDNKK